MSDDPCKLITSSLRASQLRVNKLEDKAEDNDTQVTKGRLLIPEDDEETLDLFRDAIDAAAATKGIKVHEGRDGHPLHNGDERLDLDEVKDEAVAGHYYVNVLRYEAIPGLADQDGSVVEDIDERQEMCRPGNYFNWSITFKAYNSNKKKGVWVQLNNLMFAEEGERLDGGISADKEDWFGGRSSKRSSRPGRSSNRSKRSSRPGRSERPARGSSRRGSSSTRGSRRSNRR